MNRHEARALWAQIGPALAEKGLIVPGVTMVRPDGWKSDFGLAMDELPLAFDAAQPSLTTDPNSAIPALLSTTIDPEVYRIIFAPNKAAEIFSERKAGTWLDETRMFPVVEHVGEVTSYGDFSNAGHVNVNTNWPQRQSYPMQTIKEYGQRELERAGLARISWVSEMDQAAALAINKAMNYTYFYGVANLQNYGLLNDPHLTASLTPATKAAGGTTWFVNGAPNATANEVYNDIISLFEQLVNQCAGTVDKDLKMTLAMSPASAVALTFTNSFNVNVEDLLKKNFANLTVKTAMQYGVITTSNPQGQAGGNFVQLIADSVEGQRTGYCAFTEKMRTFPIIRDLSSYKQKVMSGTWGAIIRFPAGISSMLGV